MKLVDLLVKVLPGKGGWPNGVDYFVQDRDGELKPGVDISQLPKLYDSGVWNRGRSGGMEPTYRLFLSEDWDCSPVTREQYESALAALTETAPQQVESLAWDGQGLPPVGCECEVWCEDHADYEWVRIKVFAEYKGTIIGIVNMPTQIIHDDINKYAAGYNRAEFRPVSTEAERRREAAVGAMNGHMFKMTRELAYQVYDYIAAGKIPGVKLEY